MNTTNSHGPLVFIALLAHAAVGLAEAPPASQPQEQPWHFPTSPSTSRPPDNTRSSANAERRDDDALREVPEEYQAPMAVNGIYAELFGPGLVYSLNYERIFADVVAPRIGFSYSSVSVSSGATGGTSGLLSIPITVSYLGVRSGSHSLELGAGGAFMFASQSSQAGTQSVSAWEVTGLMTMLAGYRLHPVGHAGFQFRIGVQVNAMFSGGAPITPWPNVVVGSAVIFPWPYLSLGAAF